MSNPLAGVYGVEVIGPALPTYRATVAGYAVPHVTLTPVGDSETVWNLSVGNHSVTGDYEEVCKWLPILANAMAWAAGFTSHGEHSRARNDYNVQVMRLDSPPDASEEPNP